jgi:hypothetical protein
MSDQDTYIPSSAARLLEQELRNYRDQPQVAHKIRGRSFLIAGHRGAGKTSLVINALRSLQSETLGPMASKPRRFLPIHIHGPSMFTADEPTTQPPPPPANPAPPPAAAAPPPKGDPHLRAALEQFVLCLYRALVDEVTHRYRERVQERLQQRRLQSAGLLERAAQLELELDEYPGPERLREFWEAGNFLHSGVLFPESARPNLPPDQGLRELVALNTACEAYRRVSGTFEQAKEALKLSGEKNEQTERKWDPTIKELVTPLVSLVTGGLVGVGAAAAGKTDPFLATLTGLAAAVGTSAVFKYSETRSRGRSYTKEYTFLPNRDLATLDRALPVLVGRVEATGLVPIFVVDELDKVQDLSTRMGRMVGQLKKFVSERAFFCFLTNRDYYEYLQGLSLRDAYPIEHTYFTDRLFVVFRPDDFHQYLDKVLVVPEPPPEPAPAAAVPTAPGPGGAPASPSAAAAPRVAVGPPATLPVEATQERAIAEGDREVLPYVLLQRAQMHAIDVRRQIDEIRAPDSLVALTPGSIRSHLGDRLDLMIQLAIRIVLDRNELRTPMEREPAFARLAYDALFYPSRLRRNGKDTLDLSDAGRDVFRTDLVRRMASEREIAAGVKPAEISDPDLQFLYARTRELADLLADPFALCDAMEEWEQAVGRRLSAAVRDALPLMLATGPLLVGNRDGSYTYRWGYDYLGRVISVERRTALAYQLDVEYELAVRMLLGRDAIALEPDVRRLLRAVLWVPYLWRRDQPTVPINQHELTNENLVATLAGALSAPMRQTLAATFRAEDLRAKLVALLDALAEPDTFRGRLVDEGWTAAFPLITRELRAHSPVLERSADRNEYRWQFDARGTPLTANVEVPITLEAAQWEQQIFFIRAAHATLQRVTSHTVNFGTLASGRNIIPSSPEWSTVQGAMTRLQQSARAAEPDPRDLGTVSQFATLISRQGETIALAIACAAVVIEAAGVSNPPSSLPNQLPSALGAISAAFGFNTGERRPPLDLLKSLAAEVADRWLDLSAALSHLPPLEPNRVQDWGTWIEARMRAASRNVQTDLSGSIARAWTAWQARLEAHMVGSTSSTDPELDDIVCAIAGAGPARVFRQDLKQMTLYQWSRALRLACVDGSEDDPEYVPLWVAPPALLALGLGRAVSPFLASAKTARRAMSRRPENERVDALEGLVQAIHGHVHPPEQSLLVVVQSVQQSTAATWMPSVSAGALVLELRDARALLVEPPALLKTPDTQVFGHLVTEGLPADDRLVLELKTSIGDATDRILERWDLGGIDDPSRGVRAVPRASLDDLLSHLMATAAPASALYLRSLGRDAGAVPAALRTWLAEPQRSARGRVDVLVQGFAGRLAGLLFGRLYSRHGQDAKYAGAGVKTLPASLLEEVANVVLEQPGDTFSTEFKQREKEPGTLSIETQLWRGTFRVRLEQDHIRLESFVLEPLRPETRREELLRRFVPIRRLASLLGPRLEISVGIKEGSFDFRAELITLRNSTAILIQGDFAPDMLQTQAR